MIKGREFRRFQKHDATIKKQALINFQIDLRNKLKILVCNNI